MAAPLFRTPFTDLTSGMINCQYFDRCGERELAMMECLEAYGVERGKKKCRDLIEDFQECFSLRKQMLRVTVSNYFLKIPTLINCSKNYFNLIFIKVKLFFSQIQIFIVLSK